MKHKKLLALFLTVLMLVTAIPVIASAGTHGVLTYSKSDGEITITGCNKSADGDIVIPEKIDGYPVTRIGENAFDGCQFITRITIPNSVKHIRRRAFTSCKSLTSIKLPEGITKIDEEVFAVCSALTEITIPYSVTEIDDYAFAYCYSLTDINIHDNITRIGSNAFLRCDSLTEVAIHKDVTSIGESAFSNCASLTGINIDKDNENYSSDENGVLFNKDKTWLLQYPSGKPEVAYTIPDSVTNITDWSFSFCQSIEAVAIPDSVTAIGGGAFYSCPSLNNVIIPESVTKILDYAFCLCTALTEINIPAGVGKIGNEAFDSCFALTDITINNPECIIYDSENTIFSEATIYGYNGSTAQAYAEKYNREFISIGDTCKHKYDAEVTAPTCTEQGYTTYTCSCGDSYVADYTDKTAHDYDSALTTPPTHLAFGIITYTCKCGKAYTEVIDKTTEHNYITVVTPPTCTEEGYTTYICECGDCYIADYVDALEHTDNDGDEYCDYCKDFLGSEESNNCSHICHKGGFMGFIWKIICFFQKLFGMNSVCECGMAHY